MALWLLKPRKGKEVQDYDVATGFVVRARSEHIARKLAAGHPGDEGPTVWLDPHLSSCQRLGVGEPQEIVLRSFRAG